MPREGPIFRKCCFCVPLQSCLQIWATVKVIGDIIFGIIIGFLSLFHMSLLSMIITLMLLIDGIFMVVLSVGLCMKNIRSLRVFYFYIIYGTVTSFLLALGILYTFINNNFRQNDTLMIIIGVVGFINGGINIGIILTLKSEIIKLRNKQQYDFVQMPTLTREDHSVIEEAQLSP